jgi:CRP/FNR family transcriptional regulator
MKTRKHTLPLPEVVKDLMGVSWEPVFNLNSIVRAYKKGATIFAEGDAVREMAFINTGKVKIVSEFGPETSHVLRLAKDGDIVGLRAYGNNNIFPISAIALTESELTFIPITLFDEMLHASNKFCYYFMMLLGSELRESESHMRDFSRLEMLERVALAILINLKAFGYSREKQGVLDFTLSRTDYSNIAGTTYETVIRMLSELEREGYIELENKEIRIVNEKGLRDLLEAASMKPAKKIKSKK